MAYQWCSYNDKVLTAPSGKQLVRDILPADTFRFKFTNTSYNPNVIERNEDGYYGIVVYYDWTNVSDGVWDCHVRGIKEQLNGYNCIFSNALTDYELGPSNYVSMISTCDTRNITKMERMFSGCDRLTSVPLFNTSSVTNMKLMFNYCSSLSSVSLLDTSSVINMEFMFAECRSLTSVPLFNTANVQRMESMFNGCSSLVTVNQFDLTSIKHTRRMFYNCTKVESGALALYQSAAARVAQFSTSGYYDMFYNCGTDTVTGAAELAQIPEPWK